MPEDSLPDRVRAVGSGSVLGRVMLHASTAVWRQKLDPYKGTIHERLEQFPKLSAQQLFDEVSAAGYPGGNSRVRDYVRDVRPRKPADPVVRFETPAG